MRSKILLVGLALTPAALVATGYLSLGEAKSDDCRAKPDSPSPAGLHWYYRVDRVNNRHCWYLHEQGMRVHSSMESRSRHAETQAEPAEEPVQDTTPVSVTPQRQSAITAERAKPDFATRWVDLPNSVDLNAHESVVDSNAYAPEQDVPRGQKQSSPAWAGVSTVNSDARRNAGSQTNFGSISLAGAVVLALLLISEAFIRFVRAFDWNLLWRHVRAEPVRYYEAPASAPDPEPDEGWYSETGTEPTTPEHAEAPELRRLLQRADSGLRPPRSFAPSRSVQPQPQPQPQPQHQANHTRAHSAFERLKSRSFSGMTWAPL